MESNRCWYNLSNTVTGEVWVLRRNTNEYFFLCVYLRFSLYIFALISVTPTLPFIGHDDVC